MHIWRGNAVNFYNNKQKLHSRSAASGKKNPVPVELQVQTVHDIWNPNVISSCDYKIYNNGFYRKMGVINKKKIKKIQERHSESWDNTLTENPKQLWGDHNLDGDTVRLHCNRTDAQIHNTDTDDSPPPSSPAHNRTHCVSRWQKINMARRNECRRAAALLYKRVWQIRLKNTTWLVHTRQLSAIHWNPSVYGTWACVCCVLFVCLPPDVSIRKVNTAVPPSRFSAPHKDVIRQAL